MPLSDWPVITERTDFSGWIRRLKWGPNDNYLYGAGQDSESAVWDATGTNYPVVKHWNESNFVNTMAPSPNGDVVIRVPATDTAHVTSVGNADGTGWDDMATLSPGTNEHAIGTWNADGAEFALLAKDGTLSIYTDGNWGGPDREFDLSGYTGEPLDLDWSPNASYLAVTFVVDSGGIVVVIDPSDGSEVTTFNISSKLSSVRFSERGNKLFYTDAENVTLVDVGNPDGTGWTELNTWALTGIFCMFGDFRAFDEHMVIPTLSAGGDSDDVTLLQTESPYNQEFNFPIDNASADTAEFSTNDDLLAYGDRGGRLYVRDTPQGTLTRATITATVPSNTSATVIVYEDQSGDGTADQQDSTTIESGTNEYFFEIDGDDAYDHWVEVEYDMSSASVTDATPTIESIDLDVDIIAGSVLNYTNGSIETQAGSLTTR